MRGIIVQVVIALLLLSTLALAATVDNKILEELDEQQEVPVIILLNDEPLPEVGVLSSSSEKQHRLREERNQITETQDAVLATLKVKERKSLKEKTTTIQVEEAALAEDQNYDFEIYHRYASINAVSGNLKKSAIDKLLASGKVKGIYYDKPVNLFLDVSIPLINADDVQTLTINGNSVNGSGQVVCVVDTGIDYTHPALGGCTNTSFLNGSCAKVIGGTDVADSDNDPIDSNSHGTHVAGIVASTNSTYKGVAPGAKLVALKVFPGSSSSTSTSNVIAGVDWCKNNASIFNISIITLSLGDGSENNESCDSDPLAAAANSAANAGIFVDAASGNDAHTNGISSPACASNVTSVGRTGDDDAVFSTSNSGPNLDLLAPGSSITSTTPSSNYGEKSGTSMSAPHVAGAAALFIQYWEAAYGLTPTNQQILTKFKITGKNIIDSRNSLTFSRINVLAAIQPFINFTSNSASNGTTLTTTSAFINISSDVNLSTALLEWTYSNGTTNNITMTAGNATLFSYTITGLNGGNHTYKVYGNDTVGTFGVSVTRILTVDQTPPTISFVTPSNNSYLRIAITMSISINDSANLSVSSYNITNSTPALLQSNSTSPLSTSSFQWSDTINISNSSYSDGVYTLNVIANDSLNNPANASITFTVDKTNPFLVALNKTPETAYNNDTVILRANTSDTNLNTSKILLESNFSGSWVNYTMTFESGNVFNFTLTGTSNLTNQRNISYRFHSFDKAENVNTSSIASFIVQNRAPVNFTIIAPTNASVIEVGVSTTFTSSAADYDGDSLSYTWNFGDSTTSTSQNTTHTFNSTGSITTTLNVSDSYASNVTSISLTVNDTKPPIVSTISYNSELHLQRDGSNESVNATFFDYSGISNANLTSNGTAQTATCSSASTSRSCSWKWGNFSVGSYNFTLSFADNTTAKHANSSTYSFSVTSCSDGAKNGDEGGVDCGGSCSTTCGGSSSSSSSGSSGGGGGGGGGGSVGTTSTSVSEEQSSETSEATEGGSGGETAPAAESPAAPAPITYSQTISVEEDESATVAVDNPSIPVFEIEFLSKIKKEAKLEVTSFVERPAEVPEIRNAYNYLEINLDLTPKEIKKVAVKFKVPQSWLTQNQLLAETVQLQHFNDGEWEELPTKQLVAEGEELIYEAKLDHFSYFAITAKTELETTWMRSFIPPQFGSSQFVFFGLIVLIAILLVVYFMLREKE